MQIDRYDILDSARDRITAGKYSTIRRTGADRDDPFRIGRRVVGAQQRLSHVLSHWPRDHQNVGMTRGCDKAANQNVQDRRRHC